MNLAPNLPASQPATTTRPEHAPSLFGWLAEFARDPRSIGAVAPSSTGLASLIAGTASLEHASVVVELGSGTGVFTRSILSRLGPETVFFSIEVNDRLVDCTRALCPGATVYHDSAANLGTYLDLHGVSNCDCIVSGLPWASFDAALQDSILDAVSERLRPGGEFLTFAYLQGLMLPAGRRFRRRLDGTFRRVLTTRVVWRNLPPALVYYAVR